MLCQHCKTFPENPGPTVNKKTRLYGTLSLCSILVWIFLVECWGNLNNVDAGIRSKQPVIFKKITGLK